MLCAPSPLGLSYFLRTSSVNENVIEQPSTVASILASGPSYPKFESTLHIFFSSKISDVTVLIDSMLLIQWTVKSLIKLIGPLQY